MSASATSTAPEKTAPEELAGVAGTGGVHADGAERVIAGAGAVGVDGGEIDHVMEVLEVGDDVARGRRRAAVAAGE